MILPNRKTLRLSNYDYSAPGYYFVTICTYQNKKIFGHIVGAGPCAGPDPNGPKIILNDIGLMVQSVWLNIPRKYPGIDIDEFIVMPNHCHGIIVIGRPQGGAPTLRLSLSNVMHRFKSLTTTQYRRMTQKPKLWQRSFHDHIIRNERSLHRIREYIRNNPLKWDLDEYNPKNIERKNDYDQEKIDHKNRSE